MYTPWQDASVLPGLLLLYTGRSLTILQTRRKHKKALTFVLNICTGLLSGDSLPASTCWMSRPLKYEKLTYAENKFQLNMVQLTRKKKEKVSAYEFSFVTNLIKALRAKLGPHSATNVLKTKA